MDSLSELLNTAGAVDGAKIMLLIALIAALTWLVRERNFGKSQQSQGSFQSELLKTQNTLIEMQAERNEETQRVNDKIVAMLETNYQVQDRQTDTYKVLANILTKMQQQHAGDMADLLQQTEKNTNVISQVDKGMDGLRSEVAMTDDHLQEVKNSLNSINHALESVDRRMEQLISEKDETTGAIQSLRDETKTIKDSLDRVIAFFDECDQHEERKPDNPKTGEVPVNSEE